MDNQLVHNSSNHKVPPHFYKPLLSNKLSFGDFLFRVHWWSSLPRSHQDKHGHGSDHRERGQWDSFIT